VTKKWGEKTREKNFSKKNTYIASKKRWKKSSGKSAKTSFLKTYEYRHQKMGEKREKIFFLETHEYRKKRWKKSSGKSAKTRFL